MSIFDDDYEDQSVEVVTPSGGKFKLMHEDEADYFNERAQLYLEQNKFTNISDLQDLDRILIIETMLWRWELWVSQEADYLGQPVDLNDMKKYIHDFMKELRMAKKAIGIDKVSRDKDKGESTAQYLDELRHRAKEFGVKREEELTKALTLFMELRALVTLHNNCTDEERKENGVELPDILRWLNEVAFPEYDKIDEYFRQNNQKYWRI